MTKNLLLSNQMKLTRITKALLLSFPCLLLTTNSAMAADFPTFAADELYLNHVNSSSPGRNLIVNPSANLSSCDIEASVYVLADADPTNNTCNLSVAWGWGADGARATGGTLTPHYLPPNVNTDFQARLKFDKTKVGILTEAITVENVNDIYIQFIVVANTTVDSTVKLLLDNGEEILITDTVTGAKTLITYVHSFDSPYTGTVNLQFNANDTQKLILDDVFLSTDVILAGEWEPEPAQDLTDELALVTDAALNSCLTTQIAAGSYTEVSQLTSLDCAGSKSGSYGVKIFGINDFGITSLAGLEQFSSITTLKLGYNTQLSDISALASLDLKVLKLEWTGIDNDALDVIANFTNLRVLNLDYTFNVTDAAKITDTLATFNKMEELIIRSIGYPNYDWEPDADLNTNTLKITQITDGILGDLSFLANMPLLKVYSGGGNIYTTGIEGFNSTPNLVNVNLNAMAWSDNMDLSPLMSFDQDKLVVLFLQGNESYPCASILDVVDYYAPDGKSAYTLADWTAPDDFKLDNSANGYIRIRNQCKPAPDTDGDGVNDDVDAFILDAAASIDTDNDGYPDSWNADKSASDSTTGLLIDAFPMDVAASIDTDNDGYPDSWNDGQSADTSTTGLTLDAFPNDDTRNADTAPVVSAPGNITVAATDSTGTAKTETSIAVFLTAASAIDVEDGSVSVSHDAPDTFPLGDTLVIFTATDSGSNTVTAQATVTVTDQTAPVITLVGGNSISVALNGSYDELGFSATDNIDGNVTGNVATDGDTVDTSVIGTYIITYNLVDIAGNAASEVTRQITVQDVLAPVVTVASNITVAATDSEGTAATDALIAAFLTAASATDDVDASVSVSHDAPDLFPIGVTKVTFSATDAGGNEGSQQATVTITDQTAPVITLIGDSTLTLNASDTYVEQSATAIDNVDGDVTAEVVIGGDTVDTSTPGTYTVTYNVLDSAGNAAQTMIRIITVQDASAPVVIVPSNIIVPATDSAGTLDSHADIAVFLSAASANDTLDGDVSVTHDAPTVFPLGITTVTFSSTDNDNYTGTNQATVTVTDQTAPVISLVGESSVIVDLNNSYNDAGYSASDNVDGDITDNVVVTGSVNTNTVGTYTLSYKVVDVAGNVSETLTRQITVQDASSPMVSAPENITVAATDSDGTAISDSAISVFLSAATANDAVDGDISVTDNAPNVFPIGVTTVTFSATDSADNTGTAQATITIVDQTAPVINLTDGAVELIVGNSYIEPGVSAFDNVDGDVTANVVISDTLDTSTVGTYTLTYNVTDAFGNAAQEVSRQVVVLTNDSDGDGVIDDEDAFPNDATETVDSDNDGTGDNSDDFPNDATETVDTDGDGTGDNSDVFPNDATETVDTDSDGTGDNSDTDIDGDGVLNDADADDYVAVSRENDLDRDGVADDIDNDGVDIVDAMLVIETALLAQIDSAISLDATAIDTDITAGVAAFVSDALSGTDITGIQVNSIVDGAIKRSGAHDVIIELINGVGSVVSFDALMHITPKVSIPETVFVKANEAIAFNLDLSGAPVSYPVTFAYRLETDEAVPVIIDDGVFTIDSGESMQVTLPAQSRGDYLVVFSEGVERNAAILDNVVTKIVSEENTAPAIDVALMSSGSKVTLLEESTTDAAIAITITDVDMVTEHTVVVSLNGVEILNTTNDVTNPMEVIAIDAATLGAGEQELVIVVTELDTNELYSTSATIQFNIAQSLPILADTNQDGSIIDSDGDGVSDADEGFGDTDGDGIADYLDNADLASNQQSIGSDGGAVIVSVDEGLTLSIGSTLKALESGLSDDIAIEVTAENFITVLEIPVEAQAQLEQSLMDVQAFLMPLIDFKITGARAGATVNMILPLPLAIMAKTEYRKLKDDGSLVAFSNTDGNAIMSAMTDVQGDCPVADSDVWQAGLVKDNDCVKLSIVDGGVNDDDGLANGVIVDPAIIVNLNSAPQVSLDSQSSVNEGQTISLNVIATDVDGDALTYLWTQTMGTTAILSGENTDTLTLTAPGVTADEVLSFTVSVSDGVEAVEKSVDITVADLNTAPTLSISVSSTSIEGGDVIILKASATDEQGDALSYSWVQTDGETVTLYGDNTMFLTFNAPNSNTTLSFEVTVSDGFKTTSQILSVDVSETKKDGGSFGTSILLLLVGLFGLRRRINPS